METERNVSRRARRETTSEFGVRDDHLNPSFVIQPFPLDFPFSPATIDSRAMNARPTRGWSDVDNFSITPCRRSSWNGPYRRYDRHVRRVKQESYGVHNLKNVRNSRVRLVTGFGRPDRRRTTKDS